MIRHVFEVYELSQADQPRCSALAVDREWGPEEHKWRFLLDIGRGYGIDDENGRLIGSVVVTRFADRLAAISMVLVAASHEGRGLGRRLMEHAVAAAGCETLTLYATERGRPLYEKIGFRTVVRTVKHLGTFQLPTTTATSRPATPDDLPAIMRLDASIFGADRSVMLQRLPAFAARLRVIEHDNTITGYGGAWRNDADTVIGPLVAGSAEDAKRLIADLVRDEDGPFRLDLDERHPDLMAWAVEHGLAPGSATTIMVYGPDMPGDSDHIFLPVMQALA
jgi:GNAT superfamily N-acetyltransferase